MGLVNVTETSDREILPTGQQLSTQGSGIDNNFSLPRL